MKSRKSVAWILGPFLLPLLLTGRGLAAEGPNVNGFVDFGYNYNFNKQTTNVLRTFDARANSFTLQNAEVVVSGKSDKDVSYRVDVDYGFDASQIHSTGFLSAGINAQVDLQQA
ncbi:MAG: outer membrane beta-barrel protein, partial [Elusimicrobia bacterium]|nr:outer membrane beta-barrel protein [Elusimicrobiota bacterium]